MTCIDGSEVLKQLLSLCYDLIYSFKSNCVTFMKLSVLLRTSGMSLSNSSPQSERIYMEEEEERL